MAKSWLAAWIALVVMAAATTRAADASQAKCLASKTKCVATYAKLLLKCEQKAETPGKPTDPNTDGCVDKADGKFDGGAFPVKGCFEKLEAKTPNDCITTDDTASAATLVQACVGNLMAEIDQQPSDQSKCGVGKQKCVGKKVDGLFKCHQKAQVPGNPTDPNTAACIDKVKAKFDGGTVAEKGCIVKLEAKAGNDCLPPTGNQAALEAIVDACVDGLVAALGTPPPTTTSSSTSLAPTTSSTSLAPTTSSTSTPAPTTTTSTLASSAACSANGLSVTASLQYNEPLLGGISVIVFNLDYSTAVSIPGSGNVLSVRQRITNLGGAQWTPAPNDRDTNANGVDDQLQVRVTASTTGSVQPTSIFRARYDCAGGAGTVIQASSIPCILTEATGLDGLPFPPELASQIHCNISVAAAP